MGKLHDAAKRGDVAAIGELLEQRGLFGRVPYHVNCRNDEGSTPLHSAAQNGQVEAVQALVAAGADVGAKAQWGSTPLHRAARNGQLAAVHALLAAGADVEAKDRAGDTPLHYAAYYSQAEAVRALVEAGAQVGAENKEDKTPLYYAAKQGHLEGVRALMAAGADINAKSLSGKTPLDVAKSQEIRNALSGTPQPPLQAQASGPQLPPPLVPTPQISSNTATPLAAPPPKLASFKLQPPAMFICPITQDIMEHPVVAADGYTYERVAIERWLQKSATSPMTNLPMAAAVVVPSHTIRSAIREWVDQHSRP